MFQLLCRREKRPKKLGSQVEYLSAPIDLHRDARFLKLVLDPLIAKAVLYVAFNYSNLISSSGTRI